MFSVPLYMRLGCLHCSIFFLSSSIAPINDLALMQPRLRGSRAKLQHHFPVCQTPALSAWET